MSTPEFTTALTAVLARTIDGFEELLSCDRLTGGASQETWRLQLVSAGQPSTLALRRSSGSKVSEPVGVDLATEAQLIQLAADAGIPEPAILHTLSPGDALGEGFIMEWLEGETLGNRICRHQEFSEVRPRLAFECGAILGRLHQLDKDSGGFSTPLREVTARELVEASWQQYREYATPQPMIDYSARWLLENLPENARSCLVHGDFRNGNLMICPHKGVVGVLDWELANIGDPIRDLGWLCVNSWRFGNRDLPVGGFGSIEDLLGGYESSSGIRVEEAELRFWIVFGSFWWSVCCLGMAQSWRSGAESSLERPAIGRRASEGQMDCVNLLMPGEFHRLAELDQDDDALPRLDELLGSVTAFLGGELLEETRGRARFLSRVAANSLAIVQRELQWGAQLAAEEAARLEAVLGNSGGLAEQRWQLVNGLRDGSMSLDAPGLENHLRLTVASQLQLDQPRYSALG